MCLVVFKTHIKDVCQSAIACYLENYLISLIGCDSQFVMNIDRCIKVVETMFKSGRNKKISCSVVENVDLIHCC